MSKSENSKLQNFPIFLKISNSTYVVLLKGTDEVSTTLTYEQAISQFEAVISKSRPWEQLAG